MIPFAGGRRRHSDDNEILGITGTLFDGLYAWLHRRHG